MKTIYTIVIFLAVSLFAYAQVGTFAFETAIIDGSNVVETVGTVTMTASFAGGANPGLDGYNGYGGVTGKSFYNNLSSTTLNLSFNKTVEINSLRLADAGGSFGNYVIAPIPAGTNVVANIPEGDGAVFSLNSSFDNITGISITRESGGATFFILDDVLLQTVLPVELSSFTGIPKQNSVLLNWTTQTETNNYGFYVERKSNLQSSWNSIGFVTGSGNSNSTKHYSFNDSKIESGKYSYRLKQVDNSGQFEYSKTINVTFTAPDVFALNQNYPNPFNPSTSISYSLPEASEVRLTVYNMIGQEVKQLVNGFVEAGYHEARFNAESLTSGLYLYTIEAVSKEGKLFKSTKKMTLVK